MKDLTHGALFNGIAGFPLAAEWAGILTEWTVEIDPFCNKVSKKHFPHATQHTDIHEAHNLPYVDIISGGFPCQPFSVAGKQRGNEDDRALWPQMLRIIREVKPAYVIGENVTGLISMALDGVLSSLEDEGYTCETFVLPACAVDAPHRRDRVWIIGYANRDHESKERRVQEREIAEPGGICSTAYAESKQDKRGRQGGLYPKPSGVGSEGTTSNPRHTGLHQRREPSNAEGCGSRPGNMVKDGLPERESIQGTALADANHERCQERDLPGIAAIPGWVSRELPPMGINADTHQQHGNGSGYGTGQTPFQQTPGLRPMPDFRLTEPPVCGSDDGLPSRLVRNRSKQLKAYGNAIVPQVAYQIFKAIIEIETA